MRPALKAALTRLTDQDRTDPFQAETYLDRMAPHHARQAAADARLIDAAMRAQRPQLKEI